MSDGPTYNVAFKRKRNQKTDYKKRLKLLRSKKPRFVVRVSNNLVKAQVVEYSIDGDKTIACKTSNHLKALGWSHSLNNTPAIYLTSLLLCQDLKKKNVKEVIFDLGVRNYKSGSKIFAGLKAIVDSKINCPYSEKAFPKEERIFGKHIETYKKNNISKDFEIIKEKILKM
jgi:large subunit ribosomal protein L18